jgi:hypothetical protein
MPRKSKLQKVIEAAAETPEPRTFQPYTYIRCIRASSFVNPANLVNNRTYLFMGWITNSRVYGDNAVLMDERGPFTCSIREEDFEVCK